jgi:hypothetical protein
MSSVSLLSLLIYSPLMCVYIVGCAPSCCIMLVSGFQMHLKAGHSESNCSMMLQCNIKSHYIHDIFYYFIIINGDLFPSLLTAMY